MRTSVSSWLGPLGKLDYSRKGQRGASSLLRRRCEFPNNLRDMHFSLEIYVLTTTNNHLQDEARNYVGTQDLRGFQYFVWEMPGLSRPGNSVSTNLLLLPNF